MVDRTDRATLREPVNPAPALLSRISWGAIFAGAVIALGLTILFGLMGTAMGFGAIEPRSGNPFSGLGIGTAIWWIVTSLVSLGIGGYIAGRDSGQTERSSAMAHGAAMWGFVTIVTLWIASSVIGSTVSTATNAVAGIASTGAQVVGSVGGAVLPDNASMSGPSREAREQVRREADQILSEAGIGNEELSQARDEVTGAVEGVARNPGQAGQEIDRLVDNLFGGPDAVFSPSDRERLIEELTTRAGMTPQEAEQVAARWERQAQDAAGAVQSAASNVGDAAVKASDSALDALSSAAWYAFFAGLLSLAAAMFAAAAGARRRPYSEPRV